MTRYDEMKRQYEAFNEKYPVVWTLFVKFTMELISRGFKHYSAQHGVFARIRWETDQAPTEGGSQFKINNNYSPFYARRFMETYPQYEEFFRFRKQTSKKAPATGLPELTPSHFEEP